MKKFVLMLALALPLGTVALAQDAPKTNKAKTEKACCTQKDKKTSDKQGEACKTADKKGEACKTTDKQDKGQVGQDKKQGSCCKDKKGQTTTPDKKK